MKYETQTTLKPIIFSDTLAAGSKKTYSADLVADGSIRKCILHFAAGENGTLHLRPYVIENGNITIDLITYAKGSNRYIAGDDQRYELECYTPIENHAVIYLEADNTGAADSIIDVVVLVEYEETYRTSSVIGYEGRNL